MSVVDVDVDKTGTPLAVFAEVLYNKLGRPRHVLIGMGNASHTNRVPRPVVEETQAGPTVDPARQAFAAGGFTIVDPLDERLIRDALARTVDETWPP